MGSTRSSIPVHLPVHLVKDSRIISMSSRKRIASLHSKVKMTGRETGGLQDLPWRHAHTLRVETGCWQIHNRLCDKCDLHDVQGEKHVLFKALTEKCAIWEGDTQNNSLIVLVGLTLETGAFYFDSIGAEIWNCFSWRRHKYYSFFFLRLRIFFVYQWLAVSSKPSSQPI